MYLWNDYEGKVLAGTFPLQKLLRTEGRSGFFLTRGRTGAPAVIRLTESLNDGDRLTARYSSLQALAEDSLLSIEGFGTAEFDGTPLFYLLLEPSSESLADILRERALSPEETDEVAGVVLTGLQSLHAGGFVHGLVEPESVLAAGENIKLRSDCAHASPEPPEDRAALAADVRGFADLIHRALRRSALVDESDALALPEPYASIVRQTLRGNWGLGEIAAELRRTHRLRSPLAPVGAPVAAPVPVAPPVAVSPAPPVTYVPAAAPAPVPAPPVVPVAAQTPAAPVRRAAESESAQLPLSYSAPVVAAEEEPLRSRRGGLLADEPEAPARRPAWLPIGIGVAAVLLLFAIVHAFSGHKAAPAPVRSTSAAAPPSAANVVASAPSPAAPAPATAAAPASAPAVQEHGRGAAIWRVVAYTYNREDEASSKAKAIAARHHDLHPEVFSPSGHAPYLVTLGGPATRAEADALRSRARREGLAPDVYVQNYKR